MINKERCKPNPSRPSVQVQKDVSRAGNGVAKGQDDVASEYKQVKGTPRAQQKLDWDK
jgi:hypothetical protein